MGLRGKEAWDAIALELASGKMSMEVLVSVGEMSFAEVERQKRALSYGWKGTREQKQLYGELKRRERELLMSGKAKGLRAYLRRRQLEDAEKRPDRRIQRWGMGGQVSTSRSRGMGRG